FFKKDLLPSSYNPAEGFFATANEYNLPDGYPAEERKVAFEWTDPSRATRIKEVLRADTKVSLLDSMKLQTDAVSPQARRLVKLLARIDVTPPREPNVRRVAELFPTGYHPGIDRAVALLRDWDGQESVDSVAAAIYETWVVKHLGKAVVQLVTPAAAHDLVGNGHLEAVLVYLENPDGRLGSNPTAIREAILLETLSAALEELSTRLGPDMETWTWGRLHVAKWEPAVGVLADP